MNLEKNYKSNLVEKNILEKPFKFDKYDNTVVI